MPTEKILSRVGADYLKQIFLLLEEHREARVTDLAEHFSVTASTATKAVKAVKAVKALVAAGLVSSRPYRSVFLTQVGRERAREFLERNQLIQDSLRILGIEESLAAEDADRLEHYLSPETLTALREKLLQDMPVVKKER